MNICTNEELKSEVTKAQKEVIVGTKLVYHDQHNFSKFEVVEVTEEYFVAKDEQGEEDYFWFEELQIGWKFYDKM